MRVQSLGGEDPLEKEMATHSSVLAWRIPWTEEPGGLQSIESKTDTTEATQHAHTHTLLQSPSTQHGDSLQDTSGSGVLSLPKN